MGQLTTFFHAWIIVEDLWPKLEDQRKAQSLTVLNSSSTFPYGILSSNLIHCFSVLSEDSLMVQ